MILKVYYADSLFKTRDAFKYLRSGLFEMAYTWTTFHPDETPDLVYPGDFPLVTNIKLLKKWFHAPEDSYPDIVDPLWEAYGLKVLSYQPNISWYSWSRVPVRSLSEMKGKIVRAMGYGSIDTLYKGLDLPTVQLTIAELYEALLRGTVDIVPTPYENFVGFKLYEVAKYAFGPPFANSMSNYLIRMDAFNGLPKDLQEILVDSFREGQDRWFDEYWDLQVKLRAMLENKGVTFYTLSDADLRETNKILSRYTDSFAKKYPWAARFREVSERYSGPSQ